MKSIQRFLYTSLGGSGGLEGGSGILGNSVGCMGGKDATSSLAALLLPSPNAGMVVTTTLIFQIFLQATQRLGLVMVWLLQGDR